MKLKKTSSALVPIDEAVKEAAANAGLTVDEFKQKLLKEVAEDDFTEDKLAQEYDEFIQLQKELADLRSGIEETIFRSDNSDLLLAIEAPKRWNRKYRVKG
ncbi:hypothetical protein Btru_055403 [Bulinus truncatus]|nr:hypothetical protein Btru_055403 [Bulinus truncatus]